MWRYPNALCKYLHPLFTAAEQPSVGELQSFLGTSALLSFILQTAKVALIDGERLEGLLWTQVTLLKQMNSIKNTNFSEKQLNRFTIKYMPHISLFLQRLVSFSPSR